jgi:hypothetical protein
MIASAAARRQLLTGVLGPICAAVLAVACGGGRGPDPPALVEGFNYVAGTQTALSAYQFTSDTLLVETALGIRGMGSNAVKLSMSPRYCGVEYHLPRDERIHSLRQLVELEPSYRRVLAMDFKYYLVWVYGFSGYRGGQGQTDLVSFVDGFSAQEAEQEYREMYDLVRSLLTTYAGTGKVFYLGHWEGDWHLRSDFDRDRPLEERTVAGMVEWLRTRQRAVDDAKRDTPHPDVEVYHYTEVNLVRRGMKGQPCAATLVLPQVDVDYVSYSAWDSTNDPRTAAEMRRSLFTALDFIEGQLRPRPALPAGRRVWIGEFGFPANRFNEEVADRRTRWVVRSGLEWGCPFILYWELYNNEVEPDGRQRGYWMVDDTGARTKVYFTFAEYYRQARELVAAFLSRHGRLPSREEFGRAAAELPALGEPR